MTFTLTVSYKAPATNEDHEETLTKKISEMLGSQTNNIKDAESIFLFNELLSEKLSWMQIQEILNHYHSDHSSTLFDEYKALMEKYDSLSPAEP